MCFTVNPALEKLQEKKICINVTVFRKTNRSARKSIIAYVRKYAFEHKDANGNKEKEARYTLR